MKIKEVENRVGIIKTNIRYYENEGLVSPARNTENQYREYSESDVQRLLEIKKLRMLGVSIPNLKKLYEGRLSLEDALKESLAHWEQEQQSVKEAKAACLNALRMKIDMTSLTQLDIRENKQEWQVRLAIIMKEDIVKEEITRGQLNTTIALMLLLGYSISLLTALAAQIDRSYITSILNRTPLFFLLLILAIGLSIAVSWTANVRTQLGVMVISSLIQSPLILSLTLFICPSYGVFQFLPYLWGGILLFILSLWAGSIKTRAVLFKLSTAIIASILFAAMMAGISYTLQEQFLVQGTLSLLSALMISVLWTNANSDFHSYNRYHAVRSANMMVNIVALFFNARGYYGSYNWRR